MHGPISFTAVAKSSTVAPGGLVTYKFSPTKFADPSHPAKMISQYSLFNRSFNDASQMLFVNQGAIDFWNYGEIVLPRYSIDPDRSLTQFESKPSIDDCQ